MYASTLLQSCTAYVGGIHCVKHVVQYTGWKNTSFTFNSAISLCVYIYIYSSAFGARRCRYACVCVSRTCSLKSIHTLHRLHEISETFRSPNQHERCKHQLCHLNTLLADTWRGRMQCRYYHRRPSQQPCWSHSLPKGGRRRRGRRTWPALAAAFPRKNPSSIVITCGVVGVHKRAS